MGKARRGEDPIAIVEAAYDLRAGSETWLRGLLHAASSDLDRGHGVFACRYRIDDDDRLELDGPVIELDGAPANNLLREIRERWSPPDPSLVRRAVRFGPAIATLDDLREWGFISADELDARRAWLQRLGFVDLLSVHVHDSGACHCYFGAPMSEPRRTPPAIVERWERLASHIAAGARLRESLQEADPVPEAEAIFDPDGGLHHVGEGAQSATAQERLRHAVLAVEQEHARQKPGDEALRLWKGLIDGRWSLVDSFDSHGRRYVVARRNDPHVRDPRALTPRERQVAGLLAQGHSDKLIAYELGLSGSTVHQHVRSIVSKLGAGSRVTLVSLLRQLQADRLRDDEH